MGLEGVKMEYRDFSVFGIRNIVVFLFRIDVIFFIYSVV